MITLSYAIALHVSIVILTGPHIASLRFHHIGHHIIDQPVFVPQFLVFELFLVFFIIEFLEDIFESSVIFFEDGVFGGKVEGVVAVEGELEAALCEFSDALIGVVHRHAYSSLSFEGVNFGFFFFSALSLEDHLEGSRFLNSKVTGFVLVSEGVPADDDGLLPTGHVPGYVLDDDRFSEDCTI